MNYEANVLRMECDGAILGWEDEVESQAKTWYKIRSISYVTPLLNGTQIKW